jgi:hypothetical protein
MSRKITDVCDKIMEIIPVDKPNSNTVTLRNEIQKYIDETLFFKAPELLSNGEYFAEVARILNRNIVTPTEDWHKAIKILFNNE